MKVLIIDRDTMFSNLMASKIRALGHDVYESAIKNDGIEQINVNKIDVVYFDPSPLLDAKSIIIQVRRMVHTFTYLTLMGEDVNTAKGIKNGCHNGLSKPLDPAALKETLECAERLCGLVNRLGDVRYDFPSAGGVISKSAFNQLFLSAMDRVARYGENSRALFINISNLDDIKLDDGKFAADYAISKLAHTLAQVRRQSDILAQTAINEYALLLQRPQNETESIDAAKRFATLLNSQSDIASNGVREVHLKISLVNLPSGAQDFENTSQIMGQLSSISA